MFCGKVDWAATGTMLQGIGAIIGAIAVIIAALVGGTTFRAWRRQQLLQKHMSIAEQILSAVFQAREQLANARLPIMGASERAVAKEKLIADGHQIDKSDETANIISAQVFLLRSFENPDTWKKLEQSKGLAFAYFGDDIPSAIDRILAQLYRFRVDANAWADDDKSNRAHSAKLYSTLVRGIEGELDVFAATVDQAVTDIEKVLRPILTEARTEMTINPTIKRALLEALKFAAP